MLSLSEADRARIQANQAEALRRKAARNLDKETVRALDKENILGTLSSERLMFGKHSGKTFTEIVETDPGYCRWAQAQQPNGQLAKLVEYWSMCEGKKRPADFDTGAVQKRQRFVESARIETIARPTTRKAFFRLQHPYLESIKSGQKRWEGRLKAGAAMSIAMGCHVTFSSGREDLHMVVRSVRDYRTFEDMLCDLGVETCLPGVKSLSEGVSIYHSFPGYAEKESSCGVVAMELMKPGSSFSLGM